MNRENGMGLIGCIIIIILIIAVIIVGYNFLKNTFEEKSENDIKANMLLIQGKCKVINEGNKVNKNEEAFKGQKISELKENTIIAEFLTKGILQEDKLDKYYALSNDDLKNIGLDVKNEENSYYIVNYEENEVYITRGYKNKKTGNILYKVEQTEE